MNDCRFNFLENKIRLTGLFAVCKAQKNFDAWHPQISHKIKGDKKLENGKP
jgi:hypothetical protein